MVVARKEFSDLGLYTTSISVDSIPEWAVQYQH